MPFLMILPLLGQRETYFFHENQMKKRATVLEKPVTVCRTSHCELIPL